MGRGGGCGRWDGMGERKLMGAQEWGEKSRSIWRPPRLAGRFQLDFGGLLRSFFCDHVPPKRPFANWSLTILIRSNPDKQKIELSGKNRGGSFPPLDQLHHFRPASPLSTGFPTATATSENGSPSLPTLALADLEWIEVT